MARSLIVVSLAAALACSQSRPPSSTPAPAAAPASVALFRQADGVARRLYAAAEDGQTPPVALTPKGIDAELAGLVSQRRVVYALANADGTLASVRRVAVDGTGDELLGLLTAGAYRAARGAWEVGGRTVVQLTRADGSPELLSTGASLPGLGSIARGRWVGQAGERALYLTDAASAVRDLGNLRSVKADGSGDVALGAGDGDDLFHGTAFGAVLFTAHASGAAELTSVAADGSARKSRPGSLGVLYANGRVLAVRGGLLERVDGALGATALGVPAGSTPLALLDDGSALAFLPASGLHWSDGQSSRQLDSFPADAALAARVAQGRVFYTANDAQGSHLRSAAVDGSGALELAMGVGHELIFNGLHAGRALFTRMAGVEPGGKLATVNLDGSGEALVGDVVTGTAGAADHDFGGVSLGGRVFFEAELVEHAPPRVFVVEPSGAIRPLTPSGEYTTLAALFH